MKMVIGYAPEYKLDVDNEIFFTIPKLARFLGISKDEVEKILERGELPFFNINTGILIAKSDLEQWLALHRVYKQQQKDIKDRIDFTLHIKENLQVGNV